MNTKKIKKVLPILTHFFLKVNLSVNVLCGSNPEIIVIFFLFIEDLLVILSTTRTMYGSFYTVRTMKLLIDIYLHGCIRKRVDIATKNQIKKALVRCNLNSRRITTESRQETLDLLSQVSVYLPPSGAVVRAFLFLVRFVRRKISSILSPFTTFFFFPSAVAGP